MQPEKGRYFFTSESVTEGHPDKVADQISDAILDTLIEQDPNSRVACETLVTTGMGAMIGSGGLVIMDEDTCMVEVARFFMSFTQREPKWALTGRRAPLFPPSTISPATLRRVWIARTRKIRAPAIRA